MHRRGFTLIELSIALVIIALLIGGVLVGRTLIESAAIRAQLRQFEELKTAVSNFEVKYSAVPGDIQNATNFGMATRTGAAGRGDGDGILQGCAGSTWWTLEYFGCETALFWNDLGVSGLISETYPLDVDGASPGLTIPSSQQDLYLPRAKLGRNSVAVFSMSGNDVTNYGGPTSCDMAICFSLIAMTQATSGVGAIYNPNAGVTPYQGYIIDSKIDDGLPKAGNVQANGPINLGWNYINASTFGGNNCLVGTAYNTATAFATQPVCVLSVAN